MLCNGAVIFISIKYCMENILKMALRYMIFHKKFFCYIKLYKSSVHRDK